MDSEQEFMPRKEGHKRLLQKISKVVSVISIIIAIFSALSLLMIDADDKVMRASMGALAFFCFTVGIVLNAIANTNLPNLKVGDDDSSK